MPCDSGALAVLHVLVLKSRQERSHLEDVLHADVFDVDEVVTNLHNVFVIIGFLNLPVLVPHIRRACKSYSFLLHRHEFKASRRSIDHEIIQSLSVVVIQYLLGVVIVIISLVLNELLLDLLLGLSSGDHNSLVLISFYYLKQS